MKQNIVANKYIDESFHKSNLIYIICIVEKLTMVNNLMNNKENNRKGELVWNNLMIR